MKIRSEWVTVLTLTGLAVCMMTMSKPLPSMPVQRASIATPGGIDRMPVGSTHRLDRQKPVLKR